MKISLVNNVKKVIFDLENDSAHWFHKCFLLIFPKITITSSGGQCYKCRLQDRFFVRMKHKFKNRIYQNLIKPCLVVKLISKKYIFDCIISYKDRIQCRIMDRFYFRPVIQPFNVPQQKVMSRRLKLCWKMESALTTRMKW